ncbi:MAG: bifunctional ornithine acetyltransferase/N-acetylglutamate synthase [Clostridia bacterium]|nr:bifunctional ornithine acetyltransferase/N-acetylglutamate synthase [Clostridia bacterium]
MRKNGVNRQLRPVEGGVCAVTGFKANGISCGIKENGREDLALIVAEKRCPTACVYSTCERQGAPVVITKKHLKNGHAQAVLVNGGVANVYSKDGERLAETACRLVEKYVGVSKEDTVIASTGKIGKKLDISCFEKGIKSLGNALSATQEGSMAVVSAIKGEDGTAKHCAYAFSLGDFTGRIGGVFKGSLHGSPNMATTLVFLTTDVNISSEMLSRALCSEVKETLNMLQMGDTQSPNDTVCIMANGALGNCRIDRADTEYKKFTLALRGVLTEICKEIVKADGEKTLCCKVTGARSKQTARTIAKTVVGLQGLKTAVEQGETGVESIVYAVTDCAGGADIAKLRVAFSSAGGEVTVFDEGIALNCAKDTLKRVFSAEELEVRIDAGEGNYASVGFGRAGRGG